MPEARSLRELLKIRRRHVRWLRRLPNYLGSAVGYKYRQTSGEFARSPDGKFIPAVIVFVRRKLKPTEMAGTTPIPRTFDGPAGTTCVSDVVEGALPLQPPPIPPLSSANRKLLRELTEKELGFIGGLPITANSRTGTAACVVKIGSRLGFLTNWHVAGFDGTAITREEPKRLRVGQTTRTMFIAPSTPKDPTDLESYTSASHRLDAGFIAFDNPPATAPKPGVHGLGPLGKPHELDLDSMDLVGRDVVGIGRSLGRQTGTIAAYGYEWRPYPDASTWWATDYLIVGHNRQPFAAPGDSGKLVVTADDERRPVALLWGGERQEFWTAEAQQTWSYASAIGLVLRSLRATIHNGKPATKSFR